MRGPSARHRLSAARLYCYTRPLFVVLHIPSTETLSMWLLYLLGVALLGLVAVGTGAYLAMLLSSPKFAQEVLEFLHLPPTFLQPGHCSPHGAGSFCSVSGRAAKYAVFCSARGLFSFSFSSGPLLWLSFFRPYWARCLSQPSTFHTLSVLLRFTSKVFHP